MFVIHLLTLFVHLPVRNWYAEHHFGKRKSIWTDHVINCSLVSLCSTAEIDDHDRCIHLTDLLRYISMSFSASNDSLRSLQSKRQKERGTMRWRSKAGAPSYLSASLTDANNKSDRKSIQRCVQTNDGSTQTCEALLDNYISERFKDLNKVTCIILLSRHCSKSTDSASRQEMHVTLKLTSPPRQKLADLLSQVNSSRFSSAQQEPLRRLWMKSMHF